MSGGTFGTNWLDLSNPNTTNLLVRTYVQGFVDISGGNLIVRNNNFYVTGGDASLNGRLLVGNDVSLNQRLYVGSDVSFGGRMYLANDASINGNVSLSKDLTIGGNLYVNNYTTKQTITAINYQLIVAEDISSSGRLFLAGDVSANSRLYVASDASFGGRIYAVGDVSLNSRLNVGSDASFGGRLFLNSNSLYVNGSLFTGGTSYFTTDVSMTQRLYVGTDVSMGGRLFATGDASLNNRLFVTGDTSLNSRLFIGNDVSMGGRLFVNRDISMNGNFYGNNINFSTIAVSNNINMAGVVQQFGVNVGLIPATNLTMYNMNSYVQYSNGGFTDVSLNGRLFLNTNSLYVGGSVFSGGSSYFAGDISVNNRLLLVGDASMNSRLFVGSDASFGGRIFATGDVSLNNRLFVGSDVSFGGRIFATGDVSLNSRLYVAWDVSLGDNLFVVGDVSMNSRLFVGSDVSFGGRIFATGDVSLNSRLYVAWDVSLGDNLFVVGDVSLNSRLFVGSDVSFGGRIFATGDVSLNNRLYVAWDVSLGDNLFVVGDVSINSRVFVGSDVSFGGRLFLNNDASMNGNVSLAKDLTIGGNLYVKTYTTRQTITELSYQLIVAQDLSLSGRLFSAGNLVSIAGTASTSTSTGALQVTGGAGITGNIYMGGNIYATSGTASTSSTTGALQVTGGAGFSGNIYSGSNIYSTGIINAGSVAASFTYLASGELKFRGDGFVHYSIYNKSGVLSIQNTSASEHPGTTGTAYMNFNGIGRVELPVNIASTSTSTGTLVVGGGAGIAGNLYVGGTNNYLNGNVGIGTTVPFFRLDASGDIGRAMPAVASGVHDPTMQGKTFFVGLKADTSTTADGYVGMQCIVDTTTNLGFGSTNNQSAISFKCYGYNYRASANTWGTGEIMRLRADGNVGIGTTMPAYILDVSAGNGTKIHSLYVHAQSNNGTMALGAIGQQTAGTFGTGFALYQGTAGDTVVNAQNGQTISLKINNSTIATVTSTGLGVGITNPSYPLQVRGGSVYSTTASTNATPIAGGLLHLSANSANVLGSTIGNYAPLMSIYSNLNGNSSFLSIYNYRHGTGATWSTASTRIQQTIDATNQAYIEFNPPNAMYGIGLYGNGGQTLAASAAGITITQAGNVGIGTSSPSNTLDVVGNIRASGTGYLLKTYSTGGANGDGALSVINTYRDVMGLFAPGYGNYLHIGAWDAAGAGAKNIVMQQLGGNVGIGCTPSNMLEVAGTIAIQGANVINFGNNLTKEANAGKIGYGTFTSSCLDIVGAGTSVNRKICLYDHVGVGVIPSYPLHVTSSGVNVTYGAWFQYYNGFYGSATTQGCSIYTGGGIGGGIVGAISDKRIKKNIVDIDDDVALDILRQLEPKRYNYVDEVNRGSDVDWGFIAQDVKKVFPSSILISKDFIPNIYELGTVSSDGTIVTLTDKSTSDISLNYSPLSIKFYNNSNNEIEKEIDQIIDDKTFTLKTSLDQADLSGNQIFIYGQKVDDFHTLSKDAVFTIATAAVQQIDREFQQAKQTIKDLQTQLADVLARLSAAGIP